MKRIIVLLILASVLGVAAWVLFRPSQAVVSPVESAETTVAETHAQPSAPVVRTTRQPRREVESEEPEEPEDAAADDAPFVDAWVEDLPSAYRALGQKIVDASDNEDLAALLALAREVRACPNADVRQRYVEDLSWFGTKSLTELTAFLNDANEDVAQTAVNAWDSAVDEIEDEAFRVTVAAQAMKTLTNRDSIATVVSKIEAADDHKAALLALAEVADSSNAAAMDSVKEAYEFLTGDEWQDAETARDKAQTITQEEEDEP